jgi:cytochrome P450
MFKFIQSLEPRIREIVSECLQSSGNEAVIDIVDVLAKPLPAIVIAEMMGLPEADHAQFQDWSEDLINGTSTNNTEKLERAEMANRQLVDYFRKIVALKREDPGDDLVTRMIAAEEEGDSLTETELYNTCLLLLVAGHETTTRLIGNGLYLLLTSPDQMRLLREDAALIPQAVEEMLRYEPPVQATRRFAKEDMDFHGTHFNRGDLIFVSIAGSNRDPLANDDPDAFDITRPQPQQISFGYGIHLCLGASLARLEAKVAFEELLNRYSEMSLTDDKPQWGQNAFFRGMDTLNVRVASRV